MHDHELVSRVYYRPEGYNYIIDGMEVDPTEKFRHVAGIYHTKLDEKMLGIIFAVFNGEAEVSSLEPYGIIDTVVEDWLSRLPRSMNVGDVIATEVLDEDLEVMHVIWMMCMSSGWTRCEEVPR